MSNDEELTMSVPEVSLVSNCNTLGQNHVILAKVKGWCESPPCVCNEECIISLSNITGKQLIFLLNYFKWQSKILFYCKQLKLLTSTSQCHNLSLDKNHDMSFVSHDPGMKSLLPISVIVLAPVAELGSSQFRVSISPQ